MSSIALVITSITVAFISLFLLRPLALHFGWTDIPNTRKCHAGEVPLIGGLSTLCGILVTLLLSPEMLDHQPQYIIFGLILVLIGTLDDRFDLSAKFRLAILCGLASWLIMIEGITMSYLGDLFGYGPIMMSEPTAIVFSGAAMIGSITAFNMIDGLDGLLGTISGIALVALSFVFYQSGSERDAIFCLVFVAAMLPYGLFNVVLIGRYKVFMGDAGSTLVGFTIIWLMIVVTQSNDISSVTMAPIYALWLIALPIMDMVRVILGRVAKKRSPLKADRTHIHHMLLALGYSPKSVLMFLGLLSAVMAVIGVWMNDAQVNEAYSLVWFGIVFVCYVLCAALIEASLNRKLKLAF